MSLSFKDTKNATPIAKIVNTAKIIYLMIASTLFAPIPKGKIGEFICPYCKKKFKAKHNMTYHVGNDICGKKRFHNDYWNEYICKEGEQLEILPLDGHEMIFCSGPPNCGKSYWINEYVKKYKSIFKDRHVILFTRLDDDKSLKESMYLRITIHPDILADKFEIDDFENSLVIFDDIESSKYPKVTKYLYELMDDLCKNGRHHNISVIFANQECRMGTKTKNLLTNMTMSVIFPWCCSPYQYTRLIHDHIGLTTAQMNKIFGLKSRWVAISRCAPNYAVYQNGVYLIKSTV